MQLVCAAKVAATTTTSTSPTYILVPALLKDIFDLHLTHLRKSTGRRLKIEGR
jgi:hypothetical protein